MGKTTRELFQGFRERLQRFKENKCLLKKYFKPDIIIPLISAGTPTYESNFGMCIFTGIANPPEGATVIMGINAPDPEAYTTFAPLFDAAIKDYHKMDLKQEIHHPPSYFGGVAELECSNLDPEGQYIVATRVQIHRNLSGFPFCSHSLSPETRMELESKSKEALCSLTGDLHGTYYSVDSLSQELKDELAKEHLLFDNDDTILSLNGMYKDWPDHRGMFVSDNKAFVVWVNGEDHLQMMTAGRGTNVGDVYTRMVRAIQVLGRKLSFAKDDRLGFLTYCPSNVGTALHATVHIYLPRLSSRKNFDSVCEKLNLKAKSLHMFPVEGTPHPYAISNKRTAGLTEIEAVGEMMAGVRELIRLEMEAADGKDSTSKCCIT